VELKLEINEACANLTPRRTTDNKVLMVTPPVGPEQMTPETFVQVAAAAMALFLGMQLGEDIAKQLTDPTYKPQAPAPRRRGGWPPNPEPRPPAGKRNLPKLPQAERPPVQSKTWYEFDAPPTWHNSWGRELLTQVIERADVPFSEMTEVPGIRPLKEFAARAALIKQFGKHRRGLRATVAEF
jgi:hypothetical protein